jgi:CubicO group peptidase (beta-lactamase class C family)
MTTQKATSVAPVPLLPPEGFNDGHGYVLPGATWMHATPESEGFSPARLEALRSLLKTHQTDAMMVVSRGKVVFEYGDTALVSKVASVRKSVLDLMFAVEAQHGLDWDAAMNKNVVELGLEEKRAPFLDSEKHATLEQLMMTRSGIYIPDGNGDQAKIMPQRGAYYPGTHWFYNNWDFNAAGIAFETLTHKDLFDAMRDDLAIPLRFQDFDRSRQRKNAVQDSKHFEYATYLSTRDMARLGLFALAHGGWGKTVWGNPGIIEYSEYPTTRYAEMDPRYVPPGETGHWGYGMLWWAWDPPPFPGNVNMGPWQGAFSAMGSGGQYITVFPTRDLVVVHKVNIDKDDQRHIDGGAWMTMLEMVIDAKCDSNCK